MTAPAASPPGFRAYYRCSAGCAGEHPLFEVRYRCPSCQGLLEVAHALAPITARPAAAWTALFDARARAVRGPHGSGVWGKKEWVCPELDDAHVTTLAEGHSNLFFAERLGRELGMSELFVKLCGNSHTGSFKDLGMTVLVSAVREMRARGVGIRAIACASTGDTSAALAAYGAAAEVPTIVFLPRGKVSPAQLVQPIANGARVLALDTDFDGCMAIVKELCEAEGSPIYLANSLNPLRIEGQKTVAIEIVQQLGWTAPDWLVIPGGNLGNVSALAAGLDLLVATGILTKRPRLCVAQAERANPLYRAFLRGFDHLEPMTAGETAASAIRIGNPVSYTRAVSALKRYDGVVEEATEDELAEATARADRTGLYVCPHTGVALAALKKLRERGIVAPTDRTVVISTAHGLKFSEQKANYHFERREALSNPPTYLEATTDAVRRALDL
ncbi:threonine synthase [Myxococcota bacterium]|nr:threonine synthase [Myxococcota bacterium]